MTQTFSLIEKRACLERELRMRRRVYPRWIESGRMTSEKAAHEIALMEAILADYPEPQGSLFDEGQRAARGSEQRSE